MKISVLMACYNSSLFLDRSINSVLTQTYQDWELICIDDCSTDNTYEILKEYEKNDKRIIVHRNKINSGRAAPVLNVALRYSNGDFIFLLGHDDQISANLFTNLIERYVETKADTIIPDLEFVFPNNTAENWTLAGIADVFGQNNKIIDRSIILNNRKAVELSCFGTFMHLHFIEHQLLKSIYLMNKE